MIWIPVLIVVFAIAFLLWRKLRSVRLSPQTKKKLLAQWQNASSQKDLHRRLLEGDSVIALVLQELGYTGPLGEKLKKAAAIIPALDDVWAAHKLRNRIAHEPGIRLSDEEIARAMAAFERLINKYCR